jgi:hypothetical protein
VHRLRLEFTVLPLFLGCSHTNMLKGTVSRSPSSPGSRNLLMDGAVQNEIPLIDYTHDVRVHLFGIAGLLALWLLYRIRPSQKPPRKPIKLDSGDLALLGLASDTLQNLWQRLIRCSGSPQRTLTIVEAFIRTRI